MQTASAPERCRRGGLLPGLLLVSILAGCAAPGPGAPGAGVPEAVQACRRWFDALDAEIDRSGVRDGSAARIAGVPYLRVDRFLSAFRDRLRDEAGAQAWRARLLALDAEARAVEISNLPVHAAAALGGAGAAGERAALLERTRACAARLAAHDARDAGALAHLREAAVVEDDYAGWQRVLGLYPLTRIPFAWGVRRWQADAVSAFAAAGADTRAPGPVLRYLPGPEAGRAAAGAPGGGVDGPARDALGVPRLDAAHRRALLARHAPHIEVEHGGPFDRPGEPGFDASGEPMVETAHPVVYGRQVFAHYQGAVLVQLVYTAWFPERPAAHALDLLSGRLDGIVLRVTLGEDGEPLLYDSIHPCGCYHLFLPTPRAQPRPAPDPEDEWAFVPARLGTAPAGARLRIRLASGTHYMVDAGYAGAAEGTAYALLDEDRLRTLPVAGGTRSLYAPDGLVRGSERAERFLFWPMGVPSAGAMRQWGRHATAFLGRRHFDDADLLERRFLLRLR